MKPKAATLKVIADKLDLSISTVSRALRGMPEINTETREAVLEFSKKLNYKLPSVANAGAVDQAFLIAVIVPELNYFFQQVIKGIEENALVAGFSVVYVISNESYGRELTLVNRLINHKVDGFLVCKTQESTSEEHFKHIVKLNKPLIFLDRKSHKVPGASFLINHKLAGKKVVEHLLEKGYKKIYFLGTETNYNKESSLEQGVLEAMESNRKDDYSRNFVFGDFDLESAYEKAMEILNSNDRPDAFIASSDSAAAGILKAVRDQGYNIPKDIGIIGYYDKPISSALTPTLSSVSIPATELGKRAVNMLIEQVHLGFETSDATILLEPEVVPRESTNLQRRFFGL